MLRQITVTATALNPTSSQATGEVKIADLYRGQAGSLSDALRSVAGINFLQTGPTILKPVIQGMHSNRIVIINQGLKQEGQQWGADHAPEIDPFQAGKLSVVKGAASVRYGAEALGGVILVEPEALPGEKGLKGAFQLAGNSNGRGGTLQAKLANKWGSNLAWRLIGSLKMSGDHQAPGYQLTNTGAREQSAALNLGWSLKNYRMRLDISHFGSEFGILRSAHIGSLQDFLDAIGSEQPLIVEPFSYEINSPRQRVQHELLKWEVQRNYNRLGQLKWVYGWQWDQRQEYDIRRAGRSAIPSLDLDLHHHSLEGPLQHRPWPVFKKGPLGLSSYYRLNRNIPGTGVRPLIPNYTAAGAAVYGVEQWKHGAVEWEAGWRYDYQYFRAKKFSREGYLETHELQFQNVSGLAGMTWKFHPDWSLKTNLASAFRPPNASELFSEGLHHALASIEEGNPNLLPERSAKLIPSLQWTGRSNGTLELSLFGQYVRNYIYLRPEPEPRLTIRGAFPVFTYHQTDARIWGGDFSAGRDLVPDKLHLSLKGAIVRGRDLDADDYLIYLPADRWELEMTWNADLPNSKVHFETSLAPVYTAMQRRAPADVDFLPPPPAYWLLNWHNTLRLPLQGKELWIGMDIDNALNTRYRDYLDRLRYYADALGRNVQVRMRYIL